MLPVVDHDDAPIDAGHLYKTGGADSVARLEVQGRPLETQS